MVEDTFPVQLVAESLADQYHGTEAGKVPSFFQMEENGVFPLAAIGEAAFHLSDGKDIPVA